ncbi:MAG: protein kinase [Synechococcaceae cyanobacterium SM2_3_1]|nr:protein kinase [Synechococcaceae cyanobacterium SM2_3_1]
MQTEHRDPWIGKTVGEDDRYRLEKLLGQGGMGKVYKALDLHTSTPTQAVYRAIKFLAINLVNNLDTKLRFQREMQACVLLRDPRIVQTVDFGVVPMTLGGQRQELPMLVMEMVEGKDLQQVLHQCRQMDLGRAVHLAKEIALALETVHQGVVLEGKAIQFVHRDLKPANVFVVSDGQGGESIKLGDFGLVKALGDTGERSLTHTGTYAGTPEYSSPEQISEFKTVDGRADLYSLGCMLYRMVLGSNPFGLQPGATLIDWFTAHTDNPPLPLPKDLQVPQELEQVMRKCVAKAPEDRFSSGAALAEALAVLEAQIAPIPKLPLEDRLRLVLKQNFPNQSLSLQVQRKADRLGLMITRPSADPLDYTKLQQVFRERLAGLVDESLAQISLFSRPQGQKQPDWQTCLDLASIPPAQMAAPEAAVSMGLDLSGFCLVRNRLMLTTALPDPDAAVALKVRDFHQLPSEQKLQILPHLVTWFTDFRQIAQTQVKASIAALPEKVRLWFQTLEQMSEREKSSVAIWLSRYCAEPEQVLPRLTASLLAASEAESALFKSKTSPPQKILSYHLDRVVFQAQRHWILLLYPLGPLALHLAVAAFALATVTPQTIGNLFRFLANPLVLLFSVGFMFAIVKIVSNLFKIVNIVALAKARPFAVGVTLLVLVLAGILYPAGVPLPWMIGLLLLLILPSFGLQTWILASRWRHSPLAITDMARLVLKEGPVTTIDLKDPTQEIYASEQIQAIDVKQSFIGKLLNFGDVEIVLSGLSTRQLQDVDKPGQLRALYQRQATRLEQYQEGLEGAQYLVSEDPWLQRAIGEGERYQLESLIGQGGMGRVYKAFDQQLHLPVAIKFMLGDLGHDQERLERFQGEMRASIYLTDDRVVQVLNSGGVKDQVLGRG